MHDRLPHIELRTRIGSTPVTARGRTIPPRPHRARRRSAPIAPSATALRVGTCAAPRRLVAGGWRRKRPEAIAPCRGRRLTRDMLRRGICGTGRPRIAGRSERAEPAAVSTLHRGGRTIRASVAEIVRLPVGRRSRARPLHGAPRRNRPSRHASAASRESVHMALLHGLLQVRGLLLERCRTRHVVVYRSKETLRAAVTYGGRRCGASTGRQTRPRWNHGQIARHHARSTQLLARHRGGRDPACAEAASAHSRHGARDVNVLNVVNV